MKKILITFFLIIFVLGSLWFVSKNKKHQFFGTIVNRVNTTEKMVALTFDDGTTATKTDKILDILDDAGIKATFF